MGGRNLTLALNAGSSSLKASLLEGEILYLSCLAEALGTTDSQITLKWKATGNGESETRHNFAKANLHHEEVLTYLVDKMKEKGFLEEVVAVGHRVVHGGTKFSDSAVVTQDVLEAIESVSHLAPLHNPANVAGIKLMLSILPNVPSVAVFDTSFHATLPEKAYTYPLPKEYRDLQVRKFGFHGTSVKFVSQKAQSILLSYKPDCKDDFRILVCHLGSGASVTAVVGGKSMETSMGFTPLAGLMMGTRCGSVDPSIVGFASHALDRSVDEVMIDFNKRSGLKGMVDEGESFDMRDLLNNQATSPKARLAVDMWIYTLAQYIASSMIALNGNLDALVFTAGIGEHSSEIRQRTMDQLKPVLPSTVTLDEERNSSNGEGSNCILSKDGSWPLILDIPTNEEAMIGLECVRLLNSA